MTELPTRHQKHVFGMVNREKGALLCFVTPWGKWLEVALNDELKRRNACSKPDDLDYTVEIYGNTYDLSYRRTDQVECITIRAQNGSSRPLGDTQDGKRVSQLHFYHYLVEKYWRLLRLNEDVVVPAAEVMAA